MKYIQLLILVLFISCHSVKNIIPEAEISDNDTEFIDNLFKEYQGEKPSASVIVIKDGEIHFVKSYGYADMENKVLATPNTNYRIASVTKQFTAMAIMLLVHQQKLSYNTNLKEIYPEFPDYGKDITIKALLTHRSGLVKYNRFIEQGQTKQMLDKDVLKGLLKTDSTYFKPNTKFAYSNTGYTVLAQVIEKVSGVSFADFMSKAIFQPLKMDSSTILEINKDIKNRAYGYIVKDTSIIAKDQSITSAIQGDGGVYTSVLDYYKWDRALYTDSILPQDKLKEAFYNYDEKGKSNKDGYGFGWVVNYHNGIRILQHGGSSTGFGSHVIRIPEENISVAIFTNRNKKGQELANRAKAIISHFTNGKFQMPFEIVLEKEIDRNGIDRGIDLYNQIKTDTISYSVSKEALFHFGISYINKNRNSDALKLFSALKSDYPNYFGGYYGIAVVYQQNDNTEKAIEYFKKVIEYGSANDQWASEYSQKMIDKLKK